MSGKAGKRAVTAEELRAEILADVEAEGAAIAGALRDVREKMAEAEAERDVELDAWRTEAAQARRDRVVEPPMPEPPDLKQEWSLMYRLYDEQAGLMDQRTEAMRDAAARVEAGWTEARARLVEQAHEAVQALRPVLEQVDGWRALVAEARSAVDFGTNQRRANGPSTRMRERIGLPDMLELAEGWDVLEPAPLPPQGESFGPGASDEDVFHPSRELNPNRYRTARDFL